MDISDRTTEAVVTGAIGLVAVVAVRVSLDQFYSRYERRLEQRDPPAVARRRTTFNFTRRVVVALVVTVAAWSVLSKYHVTSEIGKAVLASSASMVTTTSSGDAWRSSARSTSC